MRTKILLTGAQDAIIDDFFTHTEETFQCMSSSVRINDLYTHMQFFKPEALVYCVGKDVSSDIEVINAAREYMRYSDTILVIIGDKESLGKLTEDIVKAANLMLTKPFNIRKIQSAISEEIYSLKVQAQKAKAEEQKKEEALLKEKAKDDSPKHVLIVDDDPVMLRTVKHYLEGSYQVATAPSGKIAMKFLETRGTNLILLDYEMPVLSGPDVFKLLREKEETQNIPVVFLTGVTDSSKIKEVLAMQPDGYLLKPVDSDRLLETVEKFLG